MSYLWGIRVFLKNLTGIRVKPEESEIQKEKTGKNLAGSREGKIDISNSIEGVQIEDLSEKESHGDNSTVSSASNNVIHLRDTSPSAREDSGEKIPSVSLSPVSPSKGNPILLQAHLANLQGTNPAADESHSSASKSTLVLGEVVGSERGMNLNELQKVFSADQSVDEGEVLNNIVP